MRPASSPGCLALLLLAVIAGGCVVLTLPPEPDAQSSGGSIIPPTPPNNPTAVTFSNGSSLGVQLTYHVNQGPAQTLILPAGATQGVEAVPNCACFTVDDFTPQRGTLTNGYSFQVCSPADVFMTNTSGPFVGVSTTISGGGPSTGTISLVLQNRTSNVYHIFPSINNIPSVQVNLAPNDQTQFTVSLCQRLQVIIRDPNNAFADLAFIESPALPPGAIYAITDVGGIVLVQKQP